MDPLEGINADQSQTVPAAPEEINDSDWQDFSYLLPALEEKIAYSPLGEHAAEWIAEDRLVSEVARSAGLLGSEQPLEPDFKQFLEQGLRCPDLEHLQNLCIAFGEKQGTISRISQKDQNDFSLLVSRLCCDPKSVLSLLSVCKLICRTEQSIFTFDDLTQFVEALLLQPCLYDDSEILTVFTGLECLIVQNGLKEFTPRQIEALAAMISVYPKVPMEEGHLPVLTFHIPISGLTELLLVHAEMPADKRLKLCAYWSRCGVGLSAEARQQLASCLKEVAQPLAMPMEIEYEDDQIRPTNRFERERIVDAIGSFCFLAIRLPLLRLSDEEIQEIKGLLKELHRLSPTSEDINSVLGTLLRIYQAYSADQLKPLEKPIETLLVYAVEHMVENDVIIDYVRCLRANYPKDHVLILHGKVVHDSDICKRVSDALKAQLKQIPALDKPLDLRIAASCTLAGILSDIPGQVDCAEVIRKGFQELARTIRGDIPEYRLEELACFLFQQFPLDQSTPNEITNLICGLAMMGCNGLLPGFRTGDGVRLEEMLSTVLQEDLTVRDFDLLLWLSNLAEQGKLTPFKGTAAWSERLLQNLATCIGGDQRQSSAVVSLGKLAASNRFPILTETGKRSLHKLIENILEDLNPQAPVNCCEVLNALGSLYLKEIIPVQTATQFSSHFIPLLMDLSENYGWLTKEHKSKLLFFIDSLPACEISSTISRPVRVKYAAFIGRLRKECLSNIIQDQLGSGFHTPLFRQQPILRKRKEPTP